MKKDKHLLKRDKAVKLVLVNALLYLLALVPSIIFAQSCLASSTNLKNSLRVLHYKYDKSKILEVSIGTKSPTRISFGHHTMKEVIGDSNKYKLISSSTGSFVFIAPKAKAGERIDITIITTNGKAQDISLKIKEGYGESIMILDEAVYTKYQQDQAQEAKLMVESMIKGRKSKYDVTDFSDKSLLFKIVNPSIEINKTKIFRYDLYNLIGLVIDIKNTSKDKIECENIYLKDLFNNPLLISFGYSPNNKLNTTKCLIERGATIRAYIVMQDDLEGRV